MQTDPFGSSGPSFEFPDPQNNRCPSRPSTKLSRLGHRALGVHMNPERSLPYPAQRLSGISRDCAAPKSGCSRGYNLSRPASLQLPRLVFQSAALSALSTATTSASLLREAHSTPPTTRSQQPITKILAPLSPCRIVTYNKSTAMLPVRGRQGSEDRQLCKESLKKVGGCLVTGRASATKTCPVLGRASACIRFRSKLTGALAVDSRHATRDARQY